MNTDQLKTTAQTLVAPRKGILAIDESTGTAGKRLTSVGLPNTEENRRKFRDLFLDADGIEKYLSGAILYDETIRQESLSNTPFIEILKGKGMVPIIKVDGGTVAMETSPEEMVTQGLEGLPDRLAEYYAMGARAAKWRAEIRIGESLPSDECVKENARRMAQYASMCQQAGIVPMVEPEVLLSGTHTFSRAEEVTGQVLKETFNALVSQEIFLPGMILKTSMVVPSSNGGEEKTKEEVAEATVRTLKEQVPAETGGIVFLSGGQSSEEATENLNAIARYDDLPWPISFSYARAIQVPALELWQGKEENVENARNEYIAVLEKLVRAREGEL